MNRAGSGVACASRVIGIDEVFDARIACGAHHLADLGEDRALDLLAFGRGLDDQVALAHRRRAFDRLDPAERLVHRGFVELALLDRAGELARDPGLARVGALLRHVGQQHVIAGLRRHLRDPRAHLSRPDHADAVHCLLPKGSGMP